MDFVMQNLRYALLAAGMFATGFGLASQEDVNKGIDIVMTAAGAVTAAATWAYGLYVKWNTRSVPLVTANRVDVPTVSPVTGAVEPGATHTGN